MAVYKVDEALPTSDKIEFLNNMIIELEGKYHQAQYDLNELNAIYSGSGMRRKFHRDVNLSSSTGSFAWYNWKHIKAESGYSIWKYDSEISYKHDDNNELYIDDKLLDNEGAATAENTTAFTSVYTYNGTSYTDHTSEASTEGGTSFTICSTTSSYLYIGDDAQFAGIRFLFQTRGRGNTIKVEYSKGSGTWKELTSVDNDLVDETSNLKRNGYITFTVPTSTQPSWLKDTVNSLSRFWIRISTTATPITASKAYAIFPYNSVATLLALSSSDVTNEYWKFCDFNIPGTGSRIYATFRNIGDSAYEGDFFIASTSTTTNKQNYFRANHTLKANYLDSTFDYTGSGLFLYRNDGNAPITISQGSTGTSPLLNLLGTTMSSRKTGAGLYFPVKWNGSTYYLELYNI